MGNTMDLVIGVDEIVSVSERVAHGQIHPISGI
jgi:hypothetical protein